MPNYLLTGRDIGPAIFRALKLEDRLISQIVFTIEADGLVTAELSMHFDETPDLEAILKRYVLLEDREP